MLNFHRLSRCAQEVQVQLFFLLLFFVVAQVHGQTVQITQESPNNENHYSLIEPSDLDGDIIVAGTEFSPSSGKNARLKRMDKDGNLTWDHLIEVPGHENRAMHIIESNWGGGMGTVFGFMEEGPSEAIIYGVDDLGSILMSTKLPNNGFDGTTFLHGINCSNGGWLAVGEWVSGTSGDKAGLVVKFDASGTIAWSLHIDSEIITPGDDFDALNHVLELDDGGYFIGGSGNLEAPSGGNKQGALAAVIGFDGTLTWGLTYVHSDLSYNSVAATAVMTGNGNLYQIVSGWGDFNFLENGFSIHQIDLTNGGLASSALGSKNLHIQEHPLKAMSARAHPTDEDLFIVAGYMEINSSDIGYEPNDPPAYGTIEGDHPPFLMEINPLSTGDWINWHHVYDVPSTGFGDMVDRYDVFSNAGDQPKIFHPEMMINSSSENPYTLIGYRDIEGGAGEYDLEFISTNSTGETQCPTFQAEIIELWLPPFKSQLVSITDKDYPTLNFNVVKTNVINELIPCDACFPEVMVTIDEVTCDNITITIEPLDDDPTTVCYDIGWGDGTTTTTDGAQTLVHTWSPGFSNGTLWVSPYCCDLPSLTGIPQGNFVSVPSDCDCPSCTPLLKACQVNFDEPTITYPSSTVDFDFSLGSVLFITSLLDCGSGCDEPPYMVDLSLNSFIFSPWMSNCLDDVSGVWWVDGGVVGSFGCGAYAPLSVEMDEGSHDVTVILTLCSNTACVDERTTTVEVGGCIPPSSPRMEVHDFGLGFPCSPHQCERSFSALQSTCSSMDSDWIIDGTIVGSGSTSIASYCFDWGKHDIELRYTCPESGLTSSVTETIYCGLSPWLVAELIDVSPDWLPSNFAVNAAVDDDCRLTIEGPFANDPNSTFNPYDAMEFIYPTNEVGSPPESGLILPHIRNFGWNLSVQSANGDIIGEWDRSEVSETETLAMLEHGPGIMVEQVCFELTGPDWLVEASENQGPLSYCLDVAGCDAPANCASDVNGDNWVSVMDLLMILEDYGTQCN